MALRTPVTFKEPEAREWLDANLQRALNERASDVHLEPQRDGRFSARFRIDGLLQDKDLGELPPVDNLVARIKILANLDITEVRHPQDGHFEIIGPVGTPIDVRVSFMPTIYGEAVVMRLLNRTGFLMNFPELGFTKPQEEILAAVVRRLNGIVFVSGPSGSGKTTLLYSLLRSLNSPTRNIVTLEDPVEYQMERVRQSQVSASTGLTFAAGLRSVLRQDPDVIMVGEIRDEETAEIAIRAALTGHLVLSTLHANDAISVIVRLADIGVGRATIAAALAAVISRRLVRTICPECLEAYTPPAAVLHRFHLSPSLVTRLQQGKGCEACGGSGYRGRVGIHEIIAFDAKIRSLILDNHSYSDLVKQIRSQGVKSLRDDGIEKVLQGVTTLEEVLRVTEDDESFDSSK